MLKKLAILLLIVIAINSFFIVLGDATKAPGMLN